MKEYLHRIVDSQLKLRLEAFGATLIVGPKWCGKTTTAEKQVPLREPDLLMVITGGNMAYTREDGVKVIPIACLKD